MTTPERRHTAFISNANTGEADRRWSEWLFNSLSRYKIPVEMRSGPAATPRLGSIYWDHESSKLGRPSLSLLDEVEASRVLIVVCSPRAHASKWVDDETRHFLAANGPSGIIPVLIEDSPATAYPPSLLALPADAQPMRVDLRHARGWHAALDRERELIKIIESILGCERGDLREGHLRRERMKNRIILALCSVAILVLGGATGVAWRAKVEAEKSAAAYRLALALTNTAENTARRRIRILQLAADAAVLSSLEAQAGEILSRRPAPAREADDWLAAAAPILRRADEAGRWLVDLQLNSANDIERDSGIPPERLRAILYEHLARAQRMTKPGGVVARLELVRRQR